LLSLSAFGQTAPDAKARDVIAKAVQIMGGERYLQVKTQVVKGKYSLLGEKGLISFKSFIDVIVFPDKERTEFKGGSSRTIQTNSGSTGWIYDNDIEAIKDQTPAQVGAFKQSIRTTIDNILRGYWKGEAEASYAGRRPATLGKRNDVIRLTYKDGFVVEFEFADDGTPQKAVYKRANAAGEEIKEEDRYALFIDVDGIRTPFIIDRYTDGRQASRINYDSVEYNKPIPDSIFKRPSTPKEAKRDIKL
jgi:hypothetical protein